MSRIDEALRRAGTAPSQTGAVVTDEEVCPPLSIPEEATTSLTETAFPVELPDSAVAPAPPAQTVPVLASELENSAHAHTPSEGGVLKQIDPRLAEKIIADANMSGIPREQYRRLAGVLHDAQASTGLKVVMIASAVPAEGKTLTASNLALTLSESYRKRVLLIDGDLRRPAIHQVFRINASSGLSDGLAAPRDSKLVVRRISSYLTVLPAGRPDADPMAALISGRMRELIEEAREAFDWVIIDTPPLLLLPDAHLVAAIADGVVLVVRAESTPHALVKRAREAIGRARILGVVLNGTVTAQHAGYDGYDGYDGYYGYNDDSPPLPTTVTRR
jgi:protein-tyrosine kinase